MAFWNLHKSGLACLLAGCLAFLPAPVRAAEIFPGTDPVTGYRIGNYRGTPPTSLPGGTVLDSAAARKKQQDGVVFIDVFGVPGTEPDPLTGAWIFDAPHETIPGSVWVPNIGTGTLNITMDAYFRTELKLAAGPPPGKPVVFFCQRECWVSWNAAKRAASWGYTAVFWYPDGTDGWREGGWPLTTAAVPQAVDMD